MTDDTERNDTGDDPTDLFTSTQGTVNSPPKTPRVPERIGKYQILRQIGEGGMGVVYEAEQVEPIHRRVAIKLIKAGMDSRRVIGRFNTERQALALMNHECIARVYDAGETDEGSPYFVMEYVQGESIVTYCDKNRLSMDERLDLFIKICEGVHHAHQKGIIHRDLKPSNILVTVQDNKAQPKIIDFGIAKATLQHWAEHSVFTEFGQLVGTPAYMSPEQAEMTELDIDTRTDIYSLGVVLYELLVGAQPFGDRELRKAGMNEMIRVIREEEPSRPSTRITTLDAPNSGEIAEARRVDLAALVRELRGDLDWITLKALEKDRLRRYVSAAEMAEDVRRHLRDEPVIAGPPDLGYRAGKFVRRHRVGVVFSTALALALIAGVVGTTVGMVRARSAEREAVVEAKTATEITDFLLQLFGEADPGQARGEELTVREVLDEGSGQINFGLADQPRLRARLMEVMGRIYRTLGHTDQARSLIEDSIHLRIEELGERHPEVAGAKNSLGGTLIKTGELDLAEQVVEEALEIQRQVLDPRDPEIGRSLNNLGGIAFRRKQYPLALEYWEDGLAIREAALGPNDLAVAKMLGNIWAAHYHVGNRDRAEEYLRRALRITRDKLGEDHYRNAKLLQNLGVLQKAAGELEKAKKSFEEARAVRVKSQGQRHHDLALTLKGLGDLHNQLGEYPEAMGVLFDAVSIHEESRGISDRLTLLARQSLIVALMGAQDPRLDATVEIQRRALDSSDDVKELAKPLRLFAGTLKELGLDDEALAAEARADAIEPE